VQEILKQLLQKAGMTFLTQYDLGTVTDDSVSPPLRRTKTRIFSVKLLPPDFKKNSATST